jgi:hypothetical protein
MESYIISNLIIVTATAKLDPQNYQAMILVENDIDHTLKITNLKNTIRDFESLVHTNP